MWMSNEAHNRRRSLGQIAVVNAWFDPVPSEGSPRYRFHMDVSFQEERVGGEEGDPVRFRVGLLRCEVAVVLPTGRSGLSIDRRTIATDRRGVRITRSRERVDTKSAKGNISSKLGVGGAAAAAEGELGAGRSVTDKTVAQGETAFLLGRRSETDDGDLSWIISRADGEGILDDVIWDARSEPRFDLIDQADVAIREQEAKTNLHPTIRVEVLCRSEDLHIKDIALTDPEENALSSILSGPRKRKLAAEAFIKRELQNEGLRVGDVHDPFGRLVIGEMIVSLVDDARL